MRIFSKLGLATAARESARVLLAVLPVAL